jgi:hypothetical protein
MVVYVQTNFTVMCINYCRVITYQKCSCTTLYLTQFSPGQLTFDGRILKSTARVALVRKAADETRMTITFSNHSEQRKYLNELVVTSYKLTNNFPVIVKSSHGPNVAHGLSIGPRCVGQVG